MYLIKAMLEGACANHCMHILLNDQGHHSTIFYVTEVESETGNLSCIIQSANDVGLSSP